MNPTLEIASRHLSSYGLLHIIGTLLAGLLFFHLMFREGIAGPVLRKMIVALAVAGLVGAAIVGFVLGLAGGHGGWSGLSSTGLLLGSIAGALVFSRRHPLSLGLILDRGAVAAALWLGIGRIGCAMAGCCFGKPTTGVLGWSLPDLGGHICSRYPSQILNAIVDFLLFGLLLFLTTKETEGFAGRPWPAGRIAWLFAAAFALKRLVLDFFRGDLHPVLGPMSANQLLALVVLLLAITALKQRWLA